MRLVIGSLAPEPRLHHAVDQRRLGAEGDSQSKRLALLVLPAEGARGAGEMPEQREVADCRRAVQHSIGDRLPAQLVEPIVDSSVEVADATGERRRQYQRGRVDGWSFERPGCATQHLDGGITVRVLDGHGPAILRTRRCLRVPGTVAERDLDRTLRRLTDAAVAINSTLSLREMLHVIDESARELCGARVGETVIPDGADLSVLHP